MHYWVMPEVLLLVCNENYQEAVEAELAGDWRLDYYRYPEVDMERGLIEAQEEE